MREVSRIDVNSTELRIMQNNEKQWFEIYESSKWSRVSATKLHMLSFDKMVYEWLCQHHNSTNSPRKFPEPIKSKLLSNKIENKKPQTLTLTALLVNWLTTKFY